jgi:isopropylmalate/homocitrate/citramalate synthase
MLEILDTTLREGEQTPYVNFTVDEKVEIARMLDRVGVDMIEAGDPSVSPNVARAIERIGSLGLRAEIVAHSTAHARVSTALKPAVQTASRSFTRHRKSISMQSCTRPKRSAGDHSRACMLRKESGTEGPLHARRCHLHGF